MAQGLSRANGAGFTLSVRGVCTALGFGGTVVAGRVVARNPKP